ncbi:hypothetical protein [Variovorax soli]|uniref:Uncharacterized protein n=1 Tax=Variovorax soli TaxID=376815 RepID=A0ABU1NMR6_9BURK|nr:hypothetical protein [Variovorax soli]MDR6539753.1 hypothetical protein [Variovorax soli]
MKRRQVDLAAFGAWRFFQAVLIISGVVAILWVSEPPGAANVKDRGPRRQA